MTGFAVARLPDVPDVPDAEPGDPAWKPIRHFFGITAFGVNAFVAPERGTELVVDHHELEPGSAGHEELYVVLEGEAEFTLDGETIRAPAGTLVAVQPAGRRHARALTAGTTVLAIAGSPGKPYETSRWDARWTTGLEQAR